MSSQGFQQRKGGPYSYIPKGYQQLSVTGTAQSITPPTPDATVAEISVSGAAIRYRDDGTAPTATVGFPVSAGQTFQYQGNIAAFKVIAESGSPVLDILFYS